MHLGQHSTCANPAGQGVKASVGGYPIEPAAEGSSSFEVVEPAPSANQRLLNEVLGVVERAKHPVAMELELPAVRLGEPLERILVAPFG